jgi:MFS family permease
MSVQSIPVTGPKSSAPVSAVSSKFHIAFVVAWGICLLFYFLQYAVRSAPSVMIPELTQAYGLTTLGVSSLLGLYYYTYSTFALVSGASLDRWGAKYTIPIGILMLAGGLIMFGVGVTWMAYFGRLLQGAGAAFAFVGAVYLATHGFPARYLATAIGFTQMMGMLGGSAGQFGVAPLVHGVMSWQQFWFYSGAIALVIMVAMLALTPRREERTRPGSIWGMFDPYKIVLTNPQSYLCGISSGLLFLPTTVGGMIWGVAFLRQGWHIDYAEAVNRASMIPLGWVVGSPILGYLADHFGRRKPVLFGGMALMLVCALAILYLPANSLPPYLPGFLFGFGSGAAMIPYSMIKEVNPDEVKGSATGAMNFMVFVMSAFAAPAAGWVLQKLAGGGTLTLDIFTKGGGTAVIVAIVIAAIFALFLKETGFAARKA